MLTLYEMRGGVFSHQALTVAEAQTLLPEKLSAFGFSCGSIGKGETSATKVAIQDTLWLDFNDSPPDELALLRDVLGYPELCVEDCEHSQVLPKLEEYPDCLFLVLHAVETMVPAVQDRFHQYELDMFISPTVLVTVHEHPLLAVDHVKEHLKRGTSSIDRGAIALAHELMDALVDFYAPVLDQMENALLDLEDQLLSEPDTPAEHRFFTLQRTLLQLRRVSLKQQDVFYWLSHRDIRQISRKQALQFRDIYDHMVRVAELSDASRQILSGMLSIHLSMVSNRLNEVMRVLTMFSAILLPLTFIVGVYGMNFQHFPELNWPYGYPMVWTVMLSIAIGMLIYFKKKRWW